MGEPITMAHVLDELRTQDPYVQQKALAVLSEYGDPKVAETMLEVLPRVDTSKPGGGYVAAQIVAELARRGESRVIEPIIALFDRKLDKSGDDHQLEEVACDAFKTLMATEALPFLRSALVSKRWMHCERDVADALAVIGGRDEEPVLLQGAASKRTDLRIACLRALRTAGTERAIPTVETAAKSTNNEIALAALGTLCVLKPLQADEIFNRAVTSAVSFALKDEVIRLVRDLRELDFSERLLPLLSVADWEPLRFEILEILIERKHPLAESKLREAINFVGPSPWPKARASALLLGIRYEDEVARSLIAVLSTQTYEDKRDVNLTSVNAAGQAIVKSLITHTPPHPKRHLEVVLLLDDLRRERVKSFPRAKWIAADTIKDIVGTEYYSDYERWVAQYRSQHGLAD